MTKTPRITLLEAMQTVLMQYKPKVDAVDVSDGAYAGSLLDSLLDIIATWVGMQREELGLDLPELPDPPAGASRYPAENIVRDVAGWLQSDYLLRMITTELPGYAAALLITRAGEVNRADLVGKLTNGLATSDTDVRRAMLFHLEVAVRKLRDDLLAYAERGPVPTPEAYAAACAATAEWRRRAIAAGWPETGDDPDEDMACVGSDQLVIHQPQGQES